MKPTQLIFTIIYFVLLFFEMFLRYKGLADIEIFVKPLLMPILILYVFVYSSIRDNIFYLLVAALFFSCIGDVLLLEKLNIFIGGLASFLIAHICYIFSFKKPIKKSYIDQNKMLLLPFLALGFGMIFLIKDNLGELLIPVIVYTSVIILMGIFALNRKGTVINSSFNLVFLGASMFMLSDSLIALTRFYKPIVYDGVWIMLFYGTGQYLITEGILREMND